MSWAAVMLLVFVALPFVVGLLLPGSFRWVIALAAVAAVAEAVVAYRDLTGDEGDWGPGLEAAIYAAMFSTVFFGIWIAFAAIGRGVRKLARNRSQRREASY
jgi:uncharacterized membrane protein